MVTHQVPDRSRCELIYPVIFPFHALLPLRDVYETGAGGRGKLAWDGAGGQLEYILCPLLSLDTP